MPIINPTSPSYLSPAPIPNTVLATGVTWNTNNTAPYTLNLKGKWGAYLYYRIGRRAATALTRSGVIIVRPNDNDQIVHPFSAYDLFSSTVAANSTTVSSGGAAGTNNITVASATGFAVDDIICVHSDDSSALRVEYARVLDVTGSVISVDRAFRVSHNANDRVTNKADVRGWTFLPGNEVYEIYASNNSGQALLFNVECLVYETDTIS